MAEDKNKKTDELGKNELGEVSGGVGIGKLIKKPISQFIGPKLKYGCPTPPPEERREKILKDNNRDSEE